MAFLRNQLPDPLILTSKRSKTLLQNQSYPASLCRLLTVFVGQGGFVDGRSTLYIFQSAAVLFDVSKTYVI